MDLSAPVTLTIWTHDDANRSVFEKELIEEFMKENPNVTVDYQTYPSGKMAELLTVAFSAQSADGGEQVETVGFCCNVGSRTVFGDGLVCFLFQIIQHETLSFS